MPHSPLAQGAVPDAPHHLVTHSHPHKVVRQVDLILVSF